MVSKRIFKDHNHSVFSKSNDILERRYESRESGDSSRAIFGQRSVTKFVDLCSGDWNAVAFETRS